MKKIKKLVKEDPRPLKIIFQYSTKSIESRGIKRNLNQITKKETGTKKGEKEKNEGKKEEKKRRATRLPAGGEKFLGPFLGVKWPSES